jgi:hypothetical protein
MARKFLLDAPDFFATTMHLNTFLTRYFRIYEYTCMQFADIYPLIADQSEAKRNCDINQYGPADDYYIVG